MLLMATIAMTTDDEKTGHGHGRRNDQGYQSLVLHITLDSLGAVLELHQTMADTLRLALTLVMMQMNMKGREDMIGAELLTEENNLPEGGGEDANEGTSYVCSTVIGINVRFLVNMALIYERVC